MRIEKQIHDAHGRFAAMPESGSIPADWSETDAFFLNPFEKTVVGCMDAMENSQDEAAVDRSFANAVQALIEYRAQNIRDLTTRHIRKKE